MSHAPLSDPSLPDHPNAPVSRRRFVALTATAAAATALGSSVQAKPLRAEPSPAAAGGLVLFQGDSVTDNGRSRNNASANHAGALGNGYPLLVASALLRERPDAGWQFFNRGVSGNKVPDLEARWEADAIALKPSVLSLLIGVNDYWHTKTHGYTGTVSDFEAQLRALLSRTKAALPGVRLIVMEPFVLTIGAVNESWFPEFTARRAVVASVARAANATFVALQQHFDDAARRSGPAHWAADGVHPTPAGHALIAERWRAAAQL